MRRDGGETGLVLDSHLLAVRAALRRLLDAPPLDGLDEEARWRAELVLAEVLNNVVVHGQPRGRIVVRLRLEGEALAFRISDQGLPLPGGRLPKGVLQAPDTLSEGGFGWPLIRALASDLEYRRPRQPGAGASPAGRAATGRGGKSRRGGGGSWKSLSGPLGSRQRGENDA